MPSFMVKSWWSDQTQQGGGGGGGATSSTVALYQTKVAGFIDDLYDAYKAYSNAGAACSAGPCSDSETYHLLDLTSGHPTAGVQLETPVVLPFSRGGSVFGLNLQLNMLDALHDSGLFFYYTPAAATSSGAMIGAGVGFNGAWGRGSWSGPFNNTGVVAGPVSASVFSTPGYQGSGAGYAGFSLGLGKGPFVGLAGYQTNYVPIVGD